MPPSSNGTSVGRSFDGLALSALALGISGILGAAAYARPLSPSVLVVFGVSLTTGVGLLAAELWKDPREATLLVVVVGTVSFLIFGSIWLYGRGPHPIAGGAALLGGGVVLAAALLLALHPARPDPARYALVAKFGAPAVAETDGVQFLAAHGGDEAPQGDVLQIWLENTFDARREVEVWIAKPPGSRLRVATRAKATLGPLETGLLSIPVAVRPGATGPQDLRIWLSARGGGRRRLPWRAFRAEKPPRGPFRWLGLLAAFLHPFDAPRYLGMRGGIKVTLTGVPERSDVAASASARFQTVPRTTSAPPRRDAGERLLESRIVFLGVPIDDETASEVIGKLRLLRDRAPTAPLSLYINSPGGSVEAALAIVDTLQELPLVVSTVCMGKPHGVAALLLAAGRRGHRFAAPDATVGLTPLEGLGDTSASLSVLSDRFAAFTGQPAPLIEQAMAQRLTLDATEALRRGFVDGIMNRPRN